MQGGGHAVVLLVIFETASHLVGEGKCRCQILAWTL